MTLRTSPTPVLLQAPGQAAAAHEPITTAAAILTVSLHREAAIRIVVIKKPDPA